MEMLTLRRLFIFSFKIVLILVLMITIVLFLERALQTVDSVEERVRAVKQLPNDYADVLFIGNSHAYCTFVPDIVTEVSGRSSFNAGIPDQKIDVTAIYLEEVLKRQNPDIIVLECFSFGDSSGTYRGYKPNINSLNLSPDKIELCFNLFEDPFDAIRASTRLFDCHTNWKKPELVTQNIKYMLRPQSIVPENKGFYRLTSKMSYRSLIKFSQSSQLRFTPKINEQSITAFLRILKLCNERDIRLIATMAPFNDTYRKRIGYSRFHKMFAVFFEQFDVEFIDFNLLDHETGIVNADFEDVTGNAQHLNVYGAKKISRVMGERLR